MDHRFLCFFLWELLLLTHGLTASLISQSGGFAILGVLKGTEISVLSQSTQTHRLQLTMLPRLEEPFSSIMVLLLNSAMLRHKERSFK